MKRNRLFIIIMALVVLALCAPAALAQKKEKDKDKEKEKDYELGERIERAVAAAPNVVVSLCMASGDIVVNGWDKNEVRVVALSAKQLELQGDGATGTSTTRVEVSVSNMTKGAGEPLIAHCHGISSLEVNVPRGAVVEIKSQAGDLAVNGVSEARVHNTAGDITLGNIRRGVEAKTIAGDIDLSSSAGRINLSTVSGDIDAMDVRSLEAGDDFSARTTSGDVALVNIAQSRLSAVTTSGLITMTGALARGGTYDLKSYSGDIILNLPANSSFRISARAPRGQIVTEFQIKSAGDEDSMSLLEGRRLSGMVGAGDATLSLDTFTGTVRLQKQ